MDDTNLEINKDELKLPGLPRELVGAISPTRLKPARPVGFIGYGASIRQAGAVLR